MNTLAFFTIMIYNFTYWISKKKTEIKLANERFDSIISQVRKNSAVADIGCDHAYVSCKLVQLGISRRVYASDVREGPLQAAKANIERYGFSEYITAHLADGLDGIEAFSPDDIIIAGMGGELISKIIDKSGYVKNKNVNLILQPMTCTYELRTYLLQNGFEIKNEILCRDSGKIYEIILCSYDGIPHKTEEEFLHIGLKTHDDPLFREFVLKKTGKFEHILKGKQLSGAECGYESNLIEKFKKMIGEEV